jgi:hypothetical protein
VAWPGLPALDAWQAWLAPWRHSLLTQPDLVTQLSALAAGHAANAAS